MGRMSSDAQGRIRIRGARQHNLQNLDLDLRTGELTVVTGVSGSGKSSLVFDTLFAEGQRRYVETFSAYARQFLDRMDKPAVDRIEGVPPAIAIDQTNPVRSSRSTVGTMTELNDHLKLLFARSAQLFDRVTAQPVRHDTAQSIYATLQHEVQQWSALQAAHEIAEPRLALCFPIELPSGTSAEELSQWLSASGFARVHAERTLPRDGKEVRQFDVVADRFRLSGVEPSRAIEAIEVALKHGAGRIHVHVLNSAPAQMQQAHSAIDMIATGDAARPAWRYSTGLHCPDSDLHYAEPLASAFSFNSPIGACGTCRGFGRVIGVDYGLVIPNDKLTLRAGAIKPMQTPAWSECQDDLMRHAETAGIPRDTPWSKLTPEQRHWVIHGSPHWKGKWNQQWYGVARFFEYLESKAYKMHIRVLLSKYRSYTECPSCRGARLKPESLLWRLGSKDAADAVLPQSRRFMPADVTWSREQLEALPGLCLHDLMMLPLERVRRFFEKLEKLGSDANLNKLDSDPIFSAESKARKLLLDEINTRVRYLCEVGLGYLTLDRQSRTLSGGEVQRINLTTALGTSLVNTLFVLDEPSIGLHPRDMQRITQAMHRLRDAGNTLVVVEHDPAVMVAADRILDMGPGPGALGGRIVFDGTVDALRQADTLTGAYLGGRRQIGLGLRRLVSDATPRLLLEGARANNLKNLSIEIPLQRMVCITGVSGSGKSTLVQDTLAPALLRNFGKATDTPGAHDRLLGAEQLSDVVMVDQSPIGKTARSNPVSYVGAWDSLRERFAQTLLARERGYTAAKFSFNSGDGRCPTCMGSGFEHIEMQFLSDVYLRCQDCDGRRFRPEILEVKLDSLSVADVLDLTVAQALDTFADQPDVVRALRPLADVGLEYLRLGQPVPTLSGGEAQRLKLAGFLAEAARSGAASRQTLARKGTLFLFDEPTTGLHFDDIAKLMRALRKLLDAGHSLLVIEHNLDVIRAADWIIDLGPEGGDAGGLLVGCGTPDQLQQIAASHTGRALREYAQLLGTEPTLQQPQAVYASAARAPMPEPALRIVHAREHNLKNLSVSIPRDCLNVITGVSGSGKSTLAFDIVFNEGQRRYLESLNAYARSIVQPAGRPDVDAVWGIAPTVAIEQRQTRGGRKSTVGTVTEIWHFLRLLYVKLGTQHCVHDGTAVTAQTPQRMAAALLREHRGQHIGLLAPLVTARKGVYTELATWALARGHTHLYVDGAFVPTQGFMRLDRYKEHSIALPVVSLDVLPDNEDALRAGLEAALQLGKGVVHVMHGLGGLRAALEQGHSTAGIGQTTVLSSTRACPQCGTSYAELDPRRFSYNSKHGWCPDCVGTGLVLSKEQRKVFDDTLLSNDEAGREKTLVEADVEDLTDQPCTTCSGTRLNAEARAVRLAGVAITDVARLSVADVEQWVSQLQTPGVLGSRELEIARDLLPEIRARLQFLQSVGLGYLTLDRGAPTLSGGEAQRIRLAAQLGSNLQGVCYVLDEPTIGLHARDNALLLDALQRLSARGNTLLVVEHDETTIRRAEHIIDIGPGAGTRGGELVAQGTLQDLQACAASQTGRYLRDAMRHPLGARRSVVSGDLARTSCGAAADAKSVRTESPDHKPTSLLTIHGAHLHNLQHITVSVPLGRLVAISGVSGSGKSTLARDVLLANAQRAVEQRSTRAGREALAQGTTSVAWSGCESLTGFEFVDRVLEVDQTPIGKTPRSCPATYIGFWDTIRKLFAETLEARARGYGPGRFSFNSASGGTGTSGGAGRCPVCEGQGMRTIAMNFLPDVKVLCEACKGARFNTETLAVTWRGKSIGDVLQMEVDDAVNFFASMPSIAHPLQLLHDVGLGYLTLGQPSPTLSGGEAQRIKLVTELSKVRDDVTRRGQKAPHTLYVLDEPTVGLHMADVERLIRVLHRLVDAGHSVVVIEHDLDLIAEADWVIDLGPEGGGGGGRIVAATTPEDLVRAGTHTGVALQTVLARENR